MQLRSEIKIHSKLSHVNVVRFDKFFEDDVNAYIRLELCDNNVRAVANVWISVV